MSFLVKIPEPQNVPIISFDIVNHGIAPLETQLKRIISLNEIVASLIRNYGTSKIVWMSGGDGGHLAIFLMNWSDLVTALLVDLRKWARNEDTQIRITCHYGEVICISGADGRLQLIGDGINFCGSLVKFGHNFGVIVSTAFKNIYKSFGTCEGEFKEPRIVYLKHQSAETVYLFSVQAYPELYGHWGGNFLPEEILLDNAFRRFQEDPWSVIYHAKRLMQAHSFHHKAIAVLEKIDHRNLMYLNTQDGNRKVNLLFSGTEKRIFIEIIRFSELVEREDGNILCMDGDDGDTMYIVLQGEIGISRVDAMVIEGNDKPFSIVLGAGSIVGELAYHLQRKRTATMQAIGKTALLALEPRSLSRQMNQTEILRFFSIRTLEHICHYTSHIGMALKMSGRENPWDFIENVTTQIFEWGGKVEFIDKKFRNKGIYILISGNLYLDDGSGDRPDWRDIRESKIVGQQTLFRVLEGKNFPILFTDIPEFIVYPPNKYFIEESKLVKVMHIPLKSLKENFTLVFKDIVDAVKRSMGVHFIYDVFISFNRNDKEFAAKLKNYLNEEMIFTYMNEVEVGKVFKSEIQAALRQSRVMIAIVSANVKGTKGEKSWVEREIAYRQAIYDTVANILPLVLGDGKNEEIADGVSPIYADKREDQAFLDVLKFVRQVKSMEKALPYSTHRCFDSNEI